MQKGKWSKKAAKLIFSFLFAALLLVWLPAEAFAAEVTLTINNCVITGKDVTVVASGQVQPAPDGMYYLFELKPYEEDWCKAELLCISASGGRSYIYRPIGL